MNMVRSMYCWGLSGKVFKAIEAVDEKEYIKYDVETIMEYDLYGNCKKESRKYSYDTEWYHWEYTNEYEFYE